MCLFERSSPEEGRRLVSDIKVNVSAEYSHELCGIKDGFLAKAFPAIRNKKDLEIRFYSSQQRRDQEPTDFICDLLKLQKQLVLGMSEEALVDHIFVRLEPQIKIMWRFEIRKTRFVYWRCCLNLRKDIHVEHCGGIEIVIMLKNEVVMSVGCLMLMLVRGIGGIWKFCVDRIMSEMIIRVITRMDVKEINGSTAGIDFRGMIEDLTIDDTNLEMGIKMTILVEGTAEIEVRVRILVVVIGGKGVD
ncbi:uncharacterized protein TNCV_2086321 [Trichonephila clavipes]|nr:uncharacterized protein TNCV_2086321 [Trichonephila clavipes]